MRTYPEHTLVIHRARNGFIVKSKASKASQEDQLDGVYVFETPEGLGIFLKGVYPKMSQVGFDDVFHE